MTTTYPCPVCGAAADLTAGCASCGRAPDPAAAEVVRLNAELAELTPRVEAAHRAYAELAAELRAKRLRRDELATAVRQLAFVARGRPVAPAPDERVPRVEAKPVTVQNLLFVLGGLLVGTAAIVFTGVAWATYGPVGRSVALAAVTLLALAVPPLAGRRGLRATAETFAAVGMLLVVLDGYGAWYVDLFGLGSVPGAAYAAGVGVVTALVGLGYGRATGLTAPRFAALVAVQPVLPLIAAELSAGAWGWALAFAGTAALDLLLVTRARFVGLRVTAWVAYGCAQLATGVCALGALLGPASAVPTAVAGGPLVVAAGLVLAAGAVAGLRPLRTAGAAAVSVALGAAVVRPVAEVRFEQADLAATVAVVVLAALALGMVRLVPAPEALGARIGALAAAGLWGLVLLGLAAVSVAVTLAGSLEHGAHRAEVPLWITGVTAALVLVLPASTRRTTLVVGATVVVLTLPVALAAGAWPIVGADLVAAAVLLLAVRRWAAVAAAGLAVHAAVVATASTPAVAAVTFAGLAVLGLAAGSVLRGTVAGRSALAVGLASVPAAAAATVLAAGAGQPWPARAGLVASASLLIALVGLAGRGARPYALVALAVAVTVAAVWPDLTDVGEPLGVYPALAVVVLAAAYRIVRPAGGPLLGAAAGLNGLVLLVAVVPLVWVLFVEPYGWLDAVWSGRPGGVGLAPDGGAGVPLGSALAVVLLTGAAVLIGRWSLALAVGLVGVVALLAGAEVPWPAGPAAALVLGVGALTVLGLRWTARGLPVGVVGLLLAGAGLAGLLPTRASTLAGLGLLVVAAAVVGGAGPTSGVRVVGWLVGVTAAGSFAVAATRAADLPLAWAAYPVLFVAAVALGLAALRRGPRASGAPVSGALASGALGSGALGSGALGSGALASASARGRGGLEHRALDAAAWAVALVALLLTLGEARPGAAVCTLWGAAVAVRAVLPAETARRPLALAAGGSVLLAWWILLLSERVAVPEAYTLPFAVLALAAGHLALRARPGLSSWVAYGPGLAAALVPSLASIVVADGQYARRLLLGLGALLVVLAGAREKRQAPFVLGGATLLALAVHEIVEWDVLPRWGYLALGGLVLIAVAMTYERRLRDLRRLRGALTRMT